MPPRSTDACANGATSAQTPTSRRRSSSRTGGFTSSNCDGLIRARTGACAPQDSVQSPRSFAASVRSSAAARRIAVLLARRTKSAVRNVLGEVHDPVANRILGRDTSGSRASFDDVALVGSLDRRDEPGFVVRARTQRSDVDERNETRADSAPRQPQFVDVDLGRQRYRR